MKRIPDTIKNDDIIVECRDIWIMIPETVIIFTTILGEPVDNGTREINELIKMPEGSIINRSTQIKYKTKTCSIIPIKHG